jgi:AcrR family transcriptional regulator
MFNSWAGRRGDEVQPLGINHAPTTTGNAGVSAGRTTDAATTTARQLRADARRNREKVLRAADEMLAAHGADASIDDIASRAGVGVGTVYRNFPTKEALWEALLVARMEVLVETAKTAAAADDPGEAFIAFVRRASDEFVNSKALADAMGSAGIECGAAKREVSDRLLEAVQGLLDRAQATARVRPDVTVADISAFLLSLGQVDPSVMDAAQRSRCVALLCDSLLVGARSLLPQGNSGNPATGDQAL